MDAPGAAGPETLTAVERRILGCLVEKERATPQNYPLTLNALRLACNQTTNRDPVTDYDEATLEEALAALRQRGLTRIVYSTSNRAAKYRHVLGDVWRVDDRELAVLAVLLLRGPQTVGEIKARTERLADFADLGAVQATLERLASRPDGAFVVRHERRPGQKDARWGHLLAEEGETPAWSSAGAGEPDLPAPATGQAPGPAPSATAGPSGPSAPTAPTGPDVAEAAAVVSDLRAEVARLRTELADLRGELNAFRAQFN